MEVEVNLRNELPDDVLELFKENAPATVSVNRRASSGMRLEPSDESRLDMVEFTRQTGAACIEETGYAITGIRTDGDAVNVWFDRVTEGDDDSVEATNSDDLIAQAVEGRMDTTERVATGEVLGHYVRLVKETYQPEPLATEEWRVAIYIDGEEFPSVTNDHLHAGDAQDEFIELCEKYGLVEEAL